jgi:3-mercaptopyruvate sulfurtransferase SseA
VSDARCPCKKDIWSSAAAYDAIGLDRLDTVALLSGERIMIDIRPKDEYEGTAKDTWKNVGRLRTARHIPAEALRAKIASAGISKSMPVVLAGRELDVELFDSAQLLSDLGYTKVSILTTGIWGIWWEAHNLPGHAAWDGWVTKYPTTVPLNQ